MSNYHTLRVVLGDQLNAGHSWYRNKDSGVLYLVAEMRQETDYAQHHVQKVCAFFAAMESFALALKNAGHSVLHLTLDDTVDHPDFGSLLNKLCWQYGVSCVEYQRPDEYRLAQHFSELTLGEKVHLRLYETEHFLLPFAELAHYLPPKRHVKMEFFYRKLRKRFNLLMQGEQPVGGLWNYDADNRNKLKPADLAAIPAPLCFANPVGHILDRLAKHQVPVLGRADAHLLWPVTRQQALELLDYFCEHALPHFGRFQDAMTGQNEHGWSLYHSRLSFAMNAKILSPLVVIQTAIRRFEEANGDIDLAQIEGFVRQILGWREYIRGVYWANMPTYAETNFLGAERPLPGYFWSGNTRMNCMKQTITQSLDTSYAHHIQRLMVTGNFCLLTGIQPDAVDQWYLGIYVDAIEWVEMPNTRGMTLFADGGLVATKPYAAGGNYLNKMSDYCKGCHYDVKARASDTSCPFNSLYWHFLHRHRSRFDRNPRVAMVYRSWDKMAGEDRVAVLKRAETCLENLEAL